MFKSQLPEPVRETLFENREFGNKLESRQGCPGVGPLNPMTGVLMRGNKEKVLEDRGWRWEQASTSQGRPRTMGTTRVWERGLEQVSP